MVHMVTIVNRVTVVNFVIMAIMVTMQWIPSTLPNSDKQLFVPQTCKDYGTKQTNQMGYVPNILLQLTA